MKSESQISSLPSEHLRHLFILLALLLSLVTSVTSFAQWDPNGLLVMDQRPFYHADLCSDGNGGVWIACDELVGAFDSTLVWVQHIDTDGYRSFGESGMLVVDDNDTAFRGIEQSLDGDCIVVYNFRDEWGWRLYAQRITQQGDKLWGEEGIPITTWHSQYQVYGFDKIQTVSDDNGGLWTFWTELGEYDPYICGVNADGSLKLPGGDRLIGSTNGHDLVCRLARDGSGGVAAIFGTYPDWPHGTVRHIYAQRILANGESLYQEPQLVMDYETYPTGGYVSPYYFLYDENGGFRITANAMWQSINGDLVPQWGSEGIFVFDWEPHYTRTYLSRSVVISDQSIIQVASSGGGSEAELRMERLLEDGSRPLGEEWGPIAGEELEIPSNLSRFNQPVPGDTTFISMCRARINEIPFYNIQRVGPSGTAVWNIYVPEDDEDFEVNINNPICFLNDQSMCIEIYDHTTEKIYAFKIDLADGYVHGSTNVVEQTSATQLPVSPIAIENISPNPFNSSTTIHFSVSVPGNYQLQVINILGQLVDSHKIQSVATDDLSYTYSPSAEQASGIFFIILRDEDAMHDSQKIVLLH